MRTDPRKACKNEEERLLWALIHDGIAHPLMALTFYTWAPAIWFHNWTSHRAWPRKDYGGVWRKATALSTFSAAEAYASGRRPRMPGWPVRLRCVPCDGRVRCEVATLQWRSKSA